jgi:RNA polymerase sporulation-specific sigma factor
MRRRRKYRNSVVEQNLAIVDPIARGIACRLPPRFEFDDLRQEGRKGLIHAADKFEPARGVPFKAYARPQIRYAVWTSIRRSAYRNATCYGFYPNTEPADKRIDIEADLASAEKSCALRSRIEHLPPIERRLIEARYFNNVSLTRASRDLGLSFKAAADLLEKAFRTVRSSMNLKSSRTGCFLV